MGELQFYKRRRRINYDVLRAIVIWLFNIGVVVFLAFVLVTFLGRQVNNIGDSMAPLLENGDHVLINKITYMFGSPDRNDIIVFKPNGNENAHSHVKRVIGLPGETIQIIENTIYINGSPLKETIEVSDILDPGIAEDVYIIGSNEYFVLGDNRASSEDSRMADIGPVSRDHIEGKAWFILSPREKMGLLKDK